MKIKMFIITYNNEKDLNNNLESLFLSDFLGHKVEVNIINNHSNFKINPSFAGKISILHNSLRPDFSTGHLARNWNQAIINGFKDLNNPDCDIVITVQDDTIFDPNWLSYLLELHQDFTFVQMGVGDNLCSYLPEAIKTIGLWDERFCNVGYQEADYFLRALIHNKDKSSLNDHQHRRLINPVSFSFCHRPADANVFSPEHHKSMVYHYISEKVFKAKWPGVSANYWENNLIQNPPSKAAIPNFITYPYFEKDIYDLVGKGYIV